MKKRYILTGGISSGKSTVVSKLKEYGVKIIDADEISHQVFSNNEPLIQSIFDTTFSGLELRKYVGSIIFRNPPMKDKLEQFMHPLIRKEMAIKEDEYVDDICMLDIPLYYEKSIPTPNDFVVLVYVDETTQLMRLMQRDGLKAQDAIDRMNNQMSNNTKLELADFTIWNDGVIDDLDGFIAKFMQQEFDIVK